ncbi:YggL 50S ribosome-binding family protein [Noviherbaspirillum galbum]|uniref:DUF469 family protein n=1 Tax=Noviherbaspirillum galbum TaxID=2709383 RepID=A0A6B3SL67_9BURK|nr:YggL family protein [Noviherbaspirillum galbum]NEX60115.1 DUF469 family protein [Noviherbaspirillum galbum]
MIKADNKNRSRRLKKKLHLGQFQEFGFTVDIVFSGAESGDEAERFIDAFLGEVIEPRKLCYGGWLEGFVAHEARGSATEDDREAVAAWLSSRSDVRSFHVGPLIDAWHADS